MTVRNSLVRQLHLAQKRFVAGFADKRRGFRHEFNISQRNVASRVRLTPEISSSAARCPQMLMRSEGSGE